MTTFPSRLRAMLSSNSYFSLCQSHQLLLMMMTFMIALVWTRVLLSGNVC